MEEEDDDLYGTGPSAPAATAMNGDADKMDDDLEEGEEEEDEEEDSESVCYCAQLTYNPNTDEYHRILKL
jgi:hypothetical protein